MSLPNETLVAIFDGLPPNVLADVTRVSRRFNAVAERLLYASISITDSDSPSRTLRCCQSILGRPHLVEIIKRLQIRWQGDFRNLSAHEIADACVETGIALQCLTSLEGLDIFLGPANRASYSIHAIERILHNCRLPHLRYCSLGAEWTKGIQPYTDILPIFLGLSRSLRQLKLSDHHAALLLPSYALPSLSYFRGSPDTAGSLLPGRPVYHLALVGQDSDINRENLPQMALTSTPLRVLDLSAMQLRPQLLRNISKYLPSIENLKIRLALRHTLHYALSGITLLTGLSPVLSDFHHLVCFDLSPTEINTAQQANFAEEAALCAEWLRACPSLRTIVFPSGTEWQLDGAQWVVSPDRILRGGMKQ